MALTLLLDGARSGKSRLAEGLIPGPGPVILIATAEGRDGEMQNRILRHRESRPAHWRVVEEPVELERALSDVEGDGRVIVDCLTLWVSNLIEVGLDDGNIEARARRSAALAAARGPSTVVVSNEVGSGIVPVNGFQDPGKVFYGPDLTLEAGTTARNKDSSRDGSGTRTLAAYRRGPAWADCLIPRLDAATGTRLRTCRGG